MTRKKKIHNALKALCENLTLKKIEEGFTGFDTTQIAEKAGISRSNTSKELNSLLVEKSVVKTLGRPVYYVDRIKLEEALEFKLNEDQLQIQSISVLIEPKSRSTTNILNSIIGAEGSLKLVIKQAKAAILYPPKGLHTLLIGPTGVGKSTFAEMMYKYALENGTVSANSQFVVFNCAEYADNPNLLLSQLYGYVKGAFTGAEKERDGLIEKANGGIILLDEIHRLPSEGQEMLFMLMDKGVYRKLGETENTRKASVVFICATTEDLDSSLLKTFLRRIPMVIKIPSLSERNLTERFELIKQFFSKESKYVKVPIRIHNDVIKAFLSYNCQGNIGQLKADIQLTCARGFLEYKTCNNNQIEIDISHIPEHVYEGFFNSKENRTELMKLLQENYNKYYEFYENNDNQFNSINEYNISNNLYNEIDDKYSFYSQNGYSQEQINEILNSDFEKYLKSLLVKCDVEKKSPENNELFKIVSPKVYYAVESALKFAEGKLKKKFSKKIYIALTMHISASMENLSNRRIRDNAELNRIALDKPKEFETANLMHEILEKEIGITISKEEIGLIAMFLYIEDTELMGKNRKVAVVVLAHGKSTASSMADVCNILLETNHCKAIDMPLDEKVESVLQKAIKTVKEMDEGKGVLMLVDMGSLVAFGEIITKKTNINTRCMEMVSTPMAIEAVRKSFLPEVTLEKLVEGLQRLNPYMGRTVINKLENEIIANQNKTIITTCLTGEGTAISLAQLIKKSVSAIDEYNITIKPMNINKVEEIDEEYLKEILAVVGTVDLKLAGVPYIPIDDVIIGDGLGKIEKLITGETYKENNLNKVSEFNVITKILSDGLSFLSPVKASKELNESFKKIENSIGIQKHQRVKIGYIVHCSYMLERCIRKEPLSYINIDKLIEDNTELYNLLRKVFTPIEESFNIKIPNTELGYIMDIITG